MEENQSQKLVCKVCEKPLLDFSMSLLVFKYTKDEKHKITSAYVCHKGICDEKQNRMRRFEYDYSFELDDLIKANNYIEHINEVLNKDYYEFINESVFAEWKSIISRLYPYVIGNMSEEDKLVLKLNGIL